MEKNIQNLERPAQAPSLGLADLYYIIFRHKRKIAAISGLGVVAGVLLYFAWPLSYQSEARLFIKYVVDTKSPGQISANNSRVTTPDDRGDTLLNTELEILSSYDLALQVAGSVGPSNILAKVGGGANTNAAANFIRKHLLLDVPKNSSVIHLVFRHPDPAIVQPVLSSLIDGYYKMHLKIHRDAGEFDDFLTKQTDDLHSRLLATEQALREAKTNLGIISVEDTKKVYGEEMAQMQQELLQAQAELAERQAVADEMAKLLHSKPLNFTNQSSSATNEVTVPPAIVSEYKRVCGLLDSAAKVEQDLALKFTPENLQLKAVRNQIAENEKLKDKLESDNPGLLTVKVPGSGSGSANTAGAAQPDLNAEMAKVIGLQSKIKVLNQQLTQLKEGAGKVYASEATISDLQRRYDLQQTQYNYFSMSLEQSRIDEALGPNRVSNISPIQAPTPPFLDRTKIQKAAALLVFGGFGFALVLALIVELYVDPSLRRPAEVQAKLGLPLFVSIPLLTQNGNGQAHRLPGSIKRRLLRSSEANPSSGSDNEPEANGNQSPSSSSLSANLRPFADALRDRLITFFERKNLTHKPKLVAVTSCSEGAGASSVAAGLAASLSETGDGNVLLVDMRQQNGSAQQFIHGQLECGLDEALETDKRESALVRDNLYVVSESPTNENLPRVLPKRFRNLVPRLKTSDFDYILFDMPPVSQVSVTPRLARFMDMILIVAEAEKTDREILKRASAWLAETAPHVGVVLNKYRNYVPRRLLQDL